MEVMSILLAILVTLCTPIVWWYLSIRKYKSLDKIPGPKPLPLIGNAHTLGNTPQELLRNLYQLSTKYNGMFKIFVGKDFRVVFAKPHLMEYILSSNVHLTKSEQYNLSRPWLRDGLVLSSGNKWRSRRKMITPTFHFKILEQFFDVFNSAGEVLIAVLSKNTGRTIDIVPFLSLCTLDVICETAMGITINAQGSEHKEYVEAVKNYLKILMERFFSFWQRFDTLFYFSPNYKLNKKYLSVLHDFTNNVVTKRRREFAKRKQNLTIDEEGVKRKVALLDLLLESESSNKLSDEDLREEIDTFMFAGHDTTSSAISFIVLALADNPEVQDKLFEEIVATIGTDEHATMGQLQDMKYLDMVIRETQRLYPVVPFIERKLEEDCCIDGLIYPGGTTLMLFLFGLHRSEMVYPDPEKFDPDRFLPDNVAQRHNFAHLPFSAGPRNCIGQRFAQLVMKSIIVKIVRNFQLLSVPNYKPDLGLGGTLKSFNGICVHLVERN